MTVLENVDVRRTLVRDMPDRLATYVPPLIDPLESQGIVTAQGRYRRGVHIERSPLHRKLTDEATTIVGAHRDSDQVRRIREELHSHEPGTPEYRNAYAAMMRQYRHEGLITPSPPAPGARTT